MKSEQKPTNNFLKIKQSYLIRVLHTTELLALVILLESPITFLRDTLIVMVPLKKTADIP